MKGASDMKTRLAQVLVVAVIFGTVEVDIGGEKEPEPLTVALDRWSGRRVRLEIALTPKDPKAARLAIDWRGIVITGGERSPAPSDGQSRQDG